MPEVKYLTDFQRMQVAYAYFTLEEWKLLARCVYATEGGAYGTREAAVDEKVATMLAKFPSAVL
jgi:hypothetical protein